MIFPCSRVAEIVKRENAIRFQLERIPGGRRTKDVQQEDHGREEVDIKNPGCEKGLSNQGETFENYPG